MTSLVRQQHEIRNRALTIQPVNSSNPGEHSEGNDSSIDVELTFISIARVYTLPIDVNNVHAEGMTQVRTRLVPIPRNRACGPSSRTSLKRPVIALE